MPKAELKSRDVIFEDNQGTLWIVPHLGCLSYYDRESKELKPYYTDYTRQYKQSKRKNNTGLSVNAIVD